MRRIKYINWWQSFLFLLFMLTIIASVQIIFILIWNIFGISERYIAAYTSITNSISFLGSLYLGIRWSGRRIKNTLPVRKPSFVLVFGAIAAALGAGILVSDINNLISHFVQLPSFTQNVDDFLFGKYRILPWTIIAIMVVAPITEEGVFRGFLLGGFLKRYKPVFAILLSALLFSLCHMNPAQMPTAFLVGLLLGWIFYRTNSIIPSMIVHSVYNGSSLFFTDVLNLNIPGYNIQGSTGFQPVWFDIIGLIFMAAGIYLISREKRVEINEENPPLSSSAENSDLKNAQTQVAAVNDNKASRKRDFKGILGLIAAIAGNLLIFAAIYFAGSYMEGIKSINYFNRSTYMTLFLVIGAAIIVAGLFYITAIVLSIIHLNSKRTNKVFGILGLVLSLLPIAVLMLIIIIGVINSGTSYFSGF